MNSQGSSGEVGSIPSKQRIHTYERVEENKPRQAGAKDMLSTWRCWQGVLMARSPLVREALIHRRANETVKCVHRHTPPLDPLPATISNNGKW